ncbi:MAG: glycosyltransferase family 1 protein [Bdellovibrionota bacterium]
MQIKVLIDARMVLGRPHGIYQYVARMAQGLRVLQEKAPLEYEPVFLVSDGFPPQIFDGFQTIRAQSRFLSVGEQFEIPKILKKGHFKLYHSPSFSSLIHCPCPWVVTVHDLNHLQFGGIREKIYYGLILKKFARKAEALLTVSEFSKKDLCQWLKIDPNKIEVVPNAIKRIAVPSDKNIEEAIRPFALDKKKYFFCFANPKPHKNILKLIESYRYFRNHGGRGFELALVGPRMDEVRKLRNLTETSNSGAEGIVEVKGGVSVEDTLAILAGSCALVSPSLYEGFGLPPVEAATMGIPVLVSDIPAHREGLAALSETEIKWVKPLDRDGWVNALNAVAHGKLDAPSAQTQEAILTQNSEQKLGENMDRIYRRVLNTQV